MQITCAGGPHDLPGLLAGQFPALNFSSPQPELIQVEADAPIRVGPLVRFLEEHGAEVAEARKIRASLEDVFVPAVVLISVASTFPGLFIAVAVSEVFEAQTFSNFFRFPMIFLCGLFFPISALPFFLKPLAYALPLTYGADMLHGAINGANILTVPVDLAILAAFCVVLFMASLRNIQRRWIA
jgi:hypothetical protein